MTQQEIFIDMALKAWNVQISRTTKFIESIGDQEFSKQIAPHKNRISYLIGHLIAVNDGMISLFSKGDRAYSNFDEAFVKNADGVIGNTPDAKALRTAWKLSNEQLSSIFSSMSASDWLSRHSSMTDEDFAKEPSRNKLSVLLNRTSHVAYHLGQLVLAKEK